MSTDILSKKTLHNGRVLVKSEIKLTPIILNNLIASKDGIKGEYMEILLGSPKVLVKTFEDSLFNKYIGEVVTIDNYSDLTLTQIEADEFDISNVMSNFKQDKSRELLTSNIVYKVNIYALIRETSIMCTDKV